MCNTLGGKCYASFSAYTDSQMVTRIRLIDGRGKINALSPTQRAQFHSRELQDTDGRGVVMIQTLNHRAKAFFCCAIWEHTPSISVSLVPTLHFMGRVTGDRVCLCVWRWGTVHDVVLRCVRGSNAFQFNMLKAQ